MSTKRIDLGRATAYSDAKEVGGYEGTRTQFAVDLANAANYAADARTSKDAAVEAAQTAEAKADIATNAAASAAEDADAASSASSAALEAKEEVEDIRDELNPEIARAKDAADRAELAETHAGNSETAAREYSEAASAAMSLAEGYKNDAEASAQNAGVSANNANTSANNASQSAVSASQSATNASASASAASTSETNAANSASSALESKTAAANSATSASGSASAAAQSASSATQSASNASASASNAAESETAAEVAAQTAQDVLDSIPQDYSVLNADVDDLKNTIIDKAPVIIDIASGSIASFYDGADGMPMKSIVAQITPVQAGSGDPSPENVRPITGWTGCKVTRTGKNLLEPVAYGGTNMAYNKPVGTVITPAKRTNNALVPNEDKTAFTWTPISTWDGFGLIVPMHRRTGIHVSVQGYVQRASLYIIDESGVVLWAWNRSSAGEFNLNETINISGAYYIIYLSPGDTTDPITISMPQAEFGSSKTDYEPYAGQTAEVSFGDDPGTVYGGTLDVTTGELTVTHGLFNQWSKLIIGNTNTAGTGRVFRIPFTDISFKNTGWIVKSNFLSLVDSPETYEALPAASFYRNNASQFVMTTQNANDTKPDMERWVATNNIQLWFLLATPQVYHLTPAQMTTLLGENHVFADTGDISVEYPCDTKLYIQRLTAPDDDMVADNNIANGSYFMVGNNLYLASANIAAGEAIVPGTNCTATNLAEALNAINA